MCMSGVEKGGAPPSTPMARRTAPEWMVAQVMFDRQRRRMGGQGPNRYHRPGAVAGATQKDDEDDDSGKTVLGD